MKYILKAPAKINLAIDVLSKRPDGYHEVNLIMQSISLCDIIELKTINENKIIVATSSESVPNGNKNIVYKAAELIKDKYNIKTGVEIEIEKNIPVAAGLGGGSTDAAAVIKLLNKAWKLGMPEKEILNIGGMIGADVPFCIVGGTAFAEGLGEKLTPLNPIPDCFILLAKPDVNISTKKVYEGLDINKIDKRPDISGIIDAIDRGQLEKLAAKLCNVLEGVTIDMCPLVQTIKKSFIEYGAIGSSMSGSGPTVFGIFDNQNKAYYAYDAIKSVVNEVLLVKPFNNHEID
ncbi:MAG: 4-(cytidine 5'-diphospho)-2-C-methyl-D-erythritol kinase [Firmicutes bacterium]|nr:4-(cytidine 5'-diphospho)-2-C-methyl-D-erythritol kinase [Bacillota bacterium]